jgi:hypothetical protein
MYLCEPFLLSSSGSVKERTDTPLLKDWYWEKSELPKICSIGSFMTVPPIIVIGQSDVNFRKI